MSKYGRHFTIVGLLTIVSTFLVDRLLEGVLYFPEAASTQAGITDNLFNLHLRLISFFFSLIVVFIVYSVVVFRQRGGEEKDGDYFHGNTPLEITWTVLPIFIVIWLGILGTNDLRAMVAPQENEMTVNVIGRQWSWSFEYPDTGIQSTEMVLPKGQPVVAKMRSEDVIHSFFVPEFRVKQDIVPGHITEIRFTPTKVGTYKLRCAELCGLRHATMLADIRVVEQSEYDAWVKEQQGTGKEDAAALGAKVAQLQGCIACHSTDGSTLVGPTWKGLYGEEVELEDGTKVTADDEYLRTAIVDPNSQIVSGFLANLMPTDFGDKLSDEDINNVIAYIKSLK
jgi:cytochrome c oxidase subunit 2